MTASQPWFKPTGVLDPDKHGKFIHSLDAIAVDAGIPKEWLWKPVPALAEVVRSLHGQVQATPLRGLLWPSACVLRQRPDFLCRRKGRSWPSLSPVNTACLVQVAVGGTGGSSCSLRNRRNASSSLSDPLRL